MAGDFTVDIIWELEGYQVGFMVWHHTLRAGNAAAHLKQGTEGKN